MLQFCVSLLQLLVEDDDAAFVLVPQGPKERARQPLSLLVAHHMLDRLPHLVEGLDATLLTLKEAKNSVAVRLLQINRTDELAELYVTDGYGQNLVHRFSAGGELLQTWGGDGKEPGQFDVPHCVRIDSRNRVLVVDRTNERVQIFDREGSFQGEWTHLMAANDLYIDDDDVVYLAEAPRRISILDLDGNVITQWGEEGTGPGQMVDHPHGIWVDSRGDIYMCEVPFAPNRLTKYERVSA